MKKLAVLLTALVLTACNALPQNTTTSNTSIAKASNTMPKTHTITSNYDFDTTVNRLKTAIKSKNMTIFAVIDHQDAAKKANLTMQPATVIVFGTPKAGTPLMIKDPTFALQLPLKVLISEVDNQVLVSFNDTQAIIDDTKISFDDVKNSLANAEKLIKATVQSSQ